MIDDFVNEQIRTALRATWNDAIEQAAKVADMHAGDCEHYGAIEQALGAKHAADMIRALRVSDKERVPLPR